MGYDNAGRLNALTTPSGQVRYAYNPATGNLATLTAPDGETLTYGYDGRLRTDVPAGCPTPRPRLGDSCAAEGLWCDYSYSYTQGYGGPELGPAMRCIAGYWRLYSSGVGARPPLPPPPLTCQDRKPS